MAVKSPSVGQSEAFPAIEPSPSLSLFLSLVWCLAIFLYHMSKLAATSIQKHSEATQKAPVWPLGKPGVNWLYGGKRLTFLEALCGTSAAIDIWPLVVEFCVRGCV